MNQLEYTFQGAHSWTSSPNEAAPIRRPARSKDGCLTCRRRKVRCNEARPRCSHCERLNLDCKWRPLSNQRQSRRVASAPDESSHTGVSNYTPGVLPSSSLLQSSAACVDESFDSLFNYASFMWDGSDMMVESPRWPSQRSQESPEIDYSVQQEPIRNTSIFQRKNLTLSQDASQMTRPTERITQSPASEASSKLPDRDGVGHELEIPNTESVLIEYFVGAVVPPILAQVETHKKWSSMRQVLISMSNSSVMVRSAILAFSDLLLCRQRKPWAKNTVRHYRNAAAEVAKYGDFSILRTASSSTREDLLATLFFLSYIDLLEGRTSDAHSNLKKAFDIYKQADKSRFRTVEVRLLSWIRLLDGRAVSAGGEGLFLSDADETLLAYPSPSITEGDGASHVEEEPSAKIEDVLFDVLYQPGLVFFQKIQSFMGRISKIDPWHRSRGTVEDETDVMCIASRISKDLSALYESRPPLMDYAVAGDLTSAHVAENLAFATTRAFRTYLSNYHASKIHLHRVAYKSLPLSSETLNAIATIRHLAQLMVEGSDGQEMLPVNMLWPLLMWGCEENDPEERNWVKTQILNMENVATNARITAHVLEEVQARQDATKQRVDVRKVMHEIFDSCFAIV